jgi:toxin ParE1/3/4
VNLTAAEALAARIESSVLPLSEHPYLFRQDRVPGIREVVAHPNYIVIYRVLAE